METNSLLSLDKNLKEMTQLDRKKAVDRSNAIRPNKQARSWGFPFQLRNSYSIQKNVYLRIFPLLLGLFVVLLFSFSCASGECIDNVRLLTTNTDKLRCTERCDCNNLRYEGYCANNLCISAAREVAPKKGDLKPCRLFLPLGSCAWGMREAQPEPLKDLLWGDCKPYQVGPETTKEACLDGIDNDCNGVRDLADAACKAFCLPNQSRPCYTGPLGTANQGSCRPGTQSCKDDNTWGACVGDVLPQTETCNGQDDNCDGNIDEGVPNCPSKACSEGARRPCYTDADGCTRQADGGLLCKGACTAGVQTCRSGLWSPCEGQRAPRNELCDGLDNNCDGQVDEGCLCEDGKVQACSLGPSLEDKGICVLGSQTCVNASWGECKGAVAPQVEVCNGKDDDCDGVIDNRLASRLCAVQKGVCLGSFQRCEGEKGWLECSEQIYSQHNVNYASDEKNTDCDGLDNDCDGQIDENCTSCQLGSSRPCYEGPQGTADKGDCKSGISLCNRRSDGKFAFGVCIGQVQPNAEVCNGKDDDCDGVIDNEPASKTLCPTNQRCENGTCVPIGSEPRTETTPDGGEVTPEGNSEGMGCLVGSNEACYSGPQGTQTNSPCSEGVRFCLSTPTGTSWSRCFNDILPSPEVCNNRDDDCDGVIDNAPAGQSLCPPSYGCSNGSCVPVEASPESTPDAGPPETTIPEGGVCVPGTMQGCYSDPAFTKGVGECKEGVQTCQADGKWGTCVGEVKRSVEICDGKDNDCNGVIDDPTALSPPSCPAQQGACIGTKVACLGTQGWATSCSSADYSKHSQDYQPNENRCDGIDNDCDGKIDEGCAWAARLTGGVGLSGPSALPTAVPNVNNGRASLMVMDQAQNVFWLAFSASALTFSPSISSPAVASYTTTFSSNSFPLVLLRKTPTGTVSCSLVQETNATYKGFASAHRIQPLPNGEALIYGAFRDGNIKFDSYTLTLIQNHDLFVMKVDSSCQVKWLTRIGGYHSLMPTSLTYVPAPSGSPDLFCIAGDANGTTSFGGGTAPDLALLLGQDAFVACGQVSDGKFLMAVPFERLFGGQYATEYIADMAYDPSSQTLHVVGVGCRGLKSPTSIPSGNEFYLVALSVQHTPSLSMTPQKTYLFSTSGGTCGSAASGGPTFSPTHAFGRTIRIGGAGNLYILGSIAREITLPDSVVVTPGGNSSTETLLLALHYNATTSAYTTRWHRRIFSETQQGTPLSNTNLRAYDMVLDAQENLYLGGGFQAYLAMQPASAGFDRTKCKTLTQQSTPCVSAGDYDIFLLQLDKQGNFKWGITTGGSARQEVFNLGIHEASRFFYLFGESAGGSGKLDYHDVGFGLFLWQYPMPPQTP